MKFISVIGPKDQLDTVTRQYLCRYEIQLENAMGELKHLNNITPNAELNPYREAAGRAAEIAALYGSKACYRIAVVIQAEIEPLEHVGKIVHRQLQVDSEECHLRGFPFVEHNIRALMIAENACSEMSGIVGAHVHNFNIVVVFGSRDEVGLYFQSVG